MAEIASSNEAPIRPFVGLGLVCLAAGLWGTVGVAKNLMAGGEVVDPVLMGLVRTSLGSLAILGMAVSARSSGSAARTFPLGALVVFGLAGGVFQVSLFAAFAHVGVTVTVAVTVCAPPLIVAAGTALRRRCAPDGCLCAALGVGCAGAVMALPKTAEAASMVGVDLLGLGMLAAASFAFVAIAMSARALARGMDSLRATGLGLTATAAALAAVVGARNGQGLSELAGLSWTDHLILLYIGVAATGGAYFAFMLGMRLARSIGAGLAATMVEPALGALFAAILLGERLSAVQALGCGLMLTAMLFLFQFERRAIRFQPASRPKTQPNPHDSTKPG